MDLQLNTFPAHSIAGDTPGFGTVYFTLGTFSFVICKTQASRGVNDRAQSVSPEPTVGRW